MATQMTAIRLAHFAGDGRRELTACALLGSVGSWDAERQQRWNPHRSTERGSRGWPSDQSQPSASPQACVTLAAI
jgi:hypothetical protein